MTAPLTPARRALLPWERMGLEFLGRNGSDTVGVIDTEDKLAGACAWSLLAKDGFVRHEPGPNGPTVFLTSLGRAALADSARGGDGV